MQSWGRRAGGQTGGQALLLVGHGNNNHSVSKRVAVGAIECVHMTTARQSSILLTQEREIEKSEEASYCSILCVRGEAVAE